MSDRPHDQTVRSHELEERDDLSARVRGVLEVPLHRHLGLEPVDPKRPDAGVRLRVGGEALNNAGVLHGGILTAMLDVASYLRLLPSLGPSENAVTHDISASLLRSVAAGSQLCVSATVVPRARSIAFLRAEARSVRSPWRSARSRRASCRRRADVGPLDAKDRHCPPSARSIAAAMLCGRSICG